MNSLQTEITGRMNRLVVPQENVIVLKYSSELLTELTGLLQTRHLFDAVIVDATNCGYLFPFELFVDGARFAKSLLEIQGVLLFIKSDKAIGVVKESMMGALSFHIFDNLSELFDYSASLARHVQLATGKQAGLIEEGTDLAQQILFSTVPVLTKDGIKLKAGMDSPRKRNALLAAIDNYTPISNIMHRLITQQRMTKDEFLQELKGLEQGKAIYPIFPKVPFLVNCFRHQTPFTLKDYFIATQLATQNQVDDLLLELQSVPTRDRISLGPLAVKKGYINTRQLEIALQDQAFYGQKGEKEELKHIKTTIEESQVQSLVGHLGSTDPSNLLQNLATNRESGVLSVEHKDLQFRAQFENGKISHAKVGKVNGNSAVMEFCAAWKDGIFVFIQRTPPADLAKDVCKVTKPLDKLLLDAALAQDNCDIVLKKLPKSLDSVLEKDADEMGQLSSGTLVDPQENQKLSDAEVALMIRVYNALDGLSTLHTVIRNFGDVTTFDFARAVGLLMYYGLASVPKTDLSVPLQKFRDLTERIREKIGSELSAALLRLALRDSVGYSGRARVFALSANGEIGVDMAAAQTAETSLSTVIRDIEDWQVKYIEHASQEIDRDVLLNIIREIHQA